MRHQKKGRTLGRVRRQRTALLRGLARSLVIHGSIVTTLAKAKEVRPYIEKLITAGKSESVASRRFISSRLGSGGTAVKKLADDVAKRYKGRAGGYTRITKLGKLGVRKAESARIELV